MKFLQLAYKDKSGQSYTIELLPEETYILSDEQDADIYIDEGSGIKATIYEDSGQWIVMCLSGVLRLHGEAHGSIHLQPGMIFSFGNTQFQVSSLQMAATNIENEQGSQEKKRIFMLAVLLTCCLVFVYWINTSKQQPQQQEAVIDTASETESAIEQKQESSVNAAVISVDDNAQSLSNNSSQQLSDHYRVALNFYELGNIKKAVSTLQEGLRVSPNNTLLQEKLIDWSIKLDEEISRYYQQGCLHAKYLRQHEAMSTLRIVVELSLNASDIRYADAKRILDILEKDINARVQCGGDA